MTRDAKAGSILTDYRLWLWLGRFTGLAAIVTALGENTFPAGALFTCACCYGLSQYFKERSALKMNDNRGKDRG